MTNWEYCSIGWLYGKDFTDAIDDLGVNLIPDPDNPEKSIVRLGYITLPNGKREQISELMPTIAKLGSDGWEMVSHSAFERSGLTEIFYFKRPLT